MGLLQATNIEENFFYLNPEIKYMTPFKEFYDSDLSKGKEYSSKIMWAIYLHSDPDSRFYRMDSGERKKEISNYTQINWEDESIKKLVAGYEHRLLTKLQQSYVRLLSKLEQRDDFIAKTPFTEKNAPVLDKMFANSSAIYQQLLTIENDLSAEKKSGQIKGGRTESAAERKLL